MRVSVDQLGCTGSGLCAEAVPEVFSIDADGLAVVDPELATSVPAELAEPVLDAADACPGRCIECEGT